MRVQWYTNACVRIISSSGANILCDPWINGGAFLGSWFQWPPISENLEFQLLNEPCDGIYISHLHPDHYDPKFIRKFSNQNPGIPIYIAEFAHDWLKRSLSSITHVDTPIIELPTKVETEVGPGLNLTLFAADTCNPQICGSNVPCNVNPSVRGIDSIGVFSADNFIVVNANDAMGVSLVPRIAANIGNADLLMGHYGGASPYPQCFPEVLDKELESSRVIERACKSLIKAADLLDASFVMPFAGQYVLGGRLSRLNEQRATLPLDDAVNYLRTISDREIISMQPGGFFDLSLNFKSEDYIEPSKDLLKNYLKEISKKVFSYEKEQSFSWHSYETDLIKSAMKVVEKSKFSKVGTSCSFVIGDGIRTVTINLDQKSDESSAEIGFKPKYANVTEISMHENLLKQLCTRREQYKGFTSLHWNQADVGSHFTWKRIGAYDLNAHALLNFFGT